MRRLLFVLVLGALPLLLSACGVSSETFAHEIEEYNGVVESTLDSYLSAKSLAEKNRDVLIDFVTTGENSGNLTIPEGFSFSEEVRNILGTLPYDTPAYEAFFTAFGYNGVRHFMLFSAADFRYRVEAIWTPQGLEKIEVGVLRDGR